MRKKLSTSEPQYRLVLGNTEQESTETLGRKALRDVNTIAKHLFPRLSDLNHLVFESWNLVGDCLGYDLCLGLIRTAIQMDKKLRDQLFNIVMASKQVDEDKQNDAKRVQASANAMTLLNLAGENFSGLDLRRIRIRGANLSGAMLIRTRLRRADLTDVNLQGAWLHEANLSAAKMYGVEFGEKPWLRFSSAVTACAFSADGRWLAVGEDKSIKLFEADTQHYIHTFEEHKDRVTSLAFGKTRNAVLASGSKDKKIRVWDLNEKKLVCTFKGHKGGVMCVAFDEEDNLASGSYDTTVWLWNVRTKKSIYTFTGHTDWVTSVAFGAGDKLASASYDNTARVWDIRRRILICKFKHKSAVKSVAFAENINILASGCEDGEGHLWDTKEEKEEKKPVHTFKGTSSVNIIALIADGTRYILASGDADGGVNVWDVSKKTRLARLRKSDDAVTSVALRLTEKGLFLTIGSGETLCSLQVMQKKNNSLRMMSLWNLQPNLCALKADLTETIGLSKENDDLLRQYGAHRFFASPRSCPTSPSEIKRHLGKHRSYTQ